MTETKVTRCFLLLLVLGACDASHHSTKPDPEGDAGSPPDSQPSGCEVASRPASAPDGYFVNGNTICTADGQPHLFHGVDRPSLEYSPSGEHLSERDFRLMASWGANVVRLALNQDFWLAASPQFDAGYASLVDTAVGWAEAAGLDVILDLHWSDAGVLGGCKTSTCQQKMADDNSVDFWSELADRYRNDGHVLFELYNEPHDVSWQLWKSGGALNGGFHVAGMQELYDAVRRAGADNLVIVGGLDWAYDLSGVPANRIAGYNIAYATHPYNTAQRQPSAWDRSWGFLTATDPVIVTEFGNLNDSSCSTDYSAKLIQYADAHAASWTAWAWFPGGCTYPSLIEDWRAAPSPVGEVVKAALLGYGGPHPEVEPEDQVQLRYMFDTSAEGWVLNDYRDPDFTNLGAILPDGAAPATLRFNPNDGDPSAGSLELHVRVTATNQYVIANAQVIEDLTGKTLQARVRLASGSLNGASLSLYACSGANFACVSGPDIDPVARDSGQWASLEWNLSDVTDPAFDVKNVISVGVTVDATKAAPSAASEVVQLPDRGEAVVQIDSVTD